MVTLPFNIWSNFQLCRACHQQMENVSYLTWLTHSPASRAASCNIWVTIISHSNPSCLITQLFIIVPCQIRENAFLEKKESFHIQLLSHKKGYNFISIHTISHQRMLHFLKTPFLDVEFWTEPFAARTTPSKTCNSKISFIVWSFRWQITQSVDQSGKPSGKKHNKTSHSSIKFWKLVK